MPRNINTGSGLGPEGYANLLTLNGIDELDDVWTIFEILGYLKFATDPISAILLE